MFVVALLALVSLSFAAELAPLKEPHRDSVIAGSYIVVYKDKVSDEDFAKDLAVQAELYDVKHQYTTVLRGFAANLDDDELVEVRSNPLVDYIEKDTIMSLNACVTPVSVGSWGLTRIAQQKVINPNNLYTYPDTAGAGTVLYVIDTGVYTQHNDFSTGRATLGWKADNTWPGEDSHGHGTHVASTAAGNAYGVARKAKIVGVMVLGPDGRGSNAGVMGGIDYAVSQAISKGEKAVINMSLGGSFSATLNDAVNTAFSLGVVVVVAAGNENQDACLVSPASADKAVTVGATTQTPTKDGDQRASYSNYGSCVDVFAPGSLITAAWIGSATATNTISGTSMASPHVAGIALLLRGERPTDTPTAISESIVKTGTTNVINLACSAGTSCINSPNIMGWNGCIQG